MTAVEDVYPPGHGSPEDRPRASGNAGQLDHRAIWESVVDIFEQAATEPRVAESIGRIEQTILLSSSDVPDSGLLLVARGGRLEIRDAGSSSDHTIELALASPDLAKLAEGHLRTAMAIADGRATYSGPVRQFLRVLPLVQAMVNPPVAMGTNTDEAIQEIV